NLSAIRINTAHIEPGYIQKVKTVVDEINSEIHKHVGIMVDLKGPELRTGVFKNGSLQVNRGKEYTVGKGGDIEFNHDSALASLHEGDQILLSDGKIRMRVTKAIGGKISVKSRDSGVLRDRSRVNIPGKFIELGTLTDRDISFMEEGIKTGVNFFAQSFVQRDQDVINLQKMISERGGNQYVISKIETKSGMQNLKGIVRNSDLVMVARGDLGVELPLREVSVAQKDIIKIAHKVGVPAIVATQMLESMVKSSSPTRAEISDVTNAILDNADAVMLSEETAIGDFPVAAVRYLRMISDYVESEREEMPEPAEFFGNPVAYSIAKASKVVSQEIRADAILAFTKTGNTAKMISAIRPHAPLIAAVESENVARKLNLYWGVEPTVLDSTNLEELDFNSILNVIVKNSSLKKGNRIVITSGAPYFVFGGTNEVRVATVGNFIGRGYPLGKSVDGKVTLKQSGKGDILVVSGNTVSESVESRFRGIIFTEDIPQKLKNELISKKITILYRTRLAGGIDEGQMVHIDGFTGVIIS
ncbi:MAG: pyruvate kinase, partial [Candidatus Thermoplasmatota archaeon]|nr:pyruvate kinase [Candidatus Thermoplasmatota archaeon]